MGNMTCRNVGTGSGHTYGSGQSGATMTYDNEGRLSGWTAPSGTTATDSFLYDNEGNRVLQRTNDSNGITDTITFDSYLEIVLHNGNTTTTKYYNVNGQRVAMRMTGTLTNPFYYLVNDSLGGTSLVLSGTGVVQAVQLYAPYGAVRYSQGTVPTTYNYTGQRLDSETGLLYYGFRYYDPVTGRFVRADTTEINARGMDGWNWGAIIAVVDVVAVVTVVTVTAAPVDGATMTEVWWGISWVHDWPHATPGRCKHPRPPHPHSRPYWQTPFPKPYL